MMPDVTMGSGVPTQTPGSFVPEKTGAKTPIEQRMDLIKPLPLEGRLTRRVEYQTAKVPSLVYLFAAGASMAGSATLWAFRRPLSALFVGMWAPTFLLLGNYNKMIKLVNELAVARVP